jgi:hypothetical protein
MRRANPDRVRSSTLTNCDAHDNWPPDAFYNYFIRVGINDRR